RAYPFGRITHRSVLCSRLPHSRLPGVTDVREPNALRRAPCGRDTHRALVRHAHDPGPDPPQPRHGRLHLPPHEPHPVAMPAERPFKARARDLEHVAAPQGPARAEPRLEGAAPPRAS